MRRHALGALSAILLMTVIGSWWVCGWEESQSSVLISLCLRIGLVLGACWLAFPQLVVILSGTSLWFVLLMGCVGMMILIRPRAAILLGPAMLLLAVLQFIGWLTKPPPRQPRHVPRGDDANRLP